MGWIGGELPRHVKDAASKVGAMLHHGDSVIPDRWNPRSYGYSLVPHMMSDIQRHAVLMKHGGLWLDADVKVIKSPSMWASGWSGYTAVRLADDSPFVGTDIIYAERDWPGWSNVDTYITSLVSSRPRRISVVAFASKMILSIDGATILSPGDTFPYRSEMFTQRSVVARGFDPPANPSPPIHGLGDYVAAGLDAIGITKDRVQAVASAVGIKDCGCKQRQQKLTEFGQKYLGIGVPKQP